MAEDQGLEVVGVPNDEKVEERLVGVAWSLYDAGDYAEALVRLGPLLAHPTNRVRRVAAFCRFGLEEYDAAIDLAAGVRPKSADDLHDLGLFHLEAKQWNAAAEALRAALAIRSKGWTSWLLALALRADYRQPPDSEQHAEMMRHFDDAIAAGDVPAAAYFDLERELSWDEEFTRKLAVLELGVERLPDSSALRCALSALYANDRAKRYDDAVRVVQRLADAEVPDALAVWRCFKAHHAAGRFVEALSYLDRLPADAMRGDYGKTEIRGDVLLALGRFDEACDAFSAESKTPEGRAISLLGRGVAKLALDDPAAAATDADGATDLWMLREMEPASLWLLVDGLHELYRFEATFDAGIEALLRQIADMPAGVRAKLLYLRSCFSRTGESFSTAEAARQWVHPALGQELGWRLEEDGDHANAACARLHYWIWRLDVVPEGERQGEVDSYEPRRAHLDREGATFVAREWERTAKVVAPVHRPIASRFYRNTLRPSLFEQRMFEAVRQIAATLIAWEPDDSDGLFDFAYACESLGARREAIEAYRRVIDLAPNAPGAFNNLALILEAEGDLDGALAMMDGAIRAGQDDEKFKSRRSKLAARVERAEAERRKREQLFATAPSRWGRLNYFQRQMLAVLTVIDRFDGWEQLATLSGCEERFVPGHWDKLVELGMLIEHEGSWSINEHVAHLAALERSHAVVTRAVRADDSLRFKPIFNSKTEYTIYSLLLQLFPNHLVFPNMALQTMFQYERMQEVLDRAEFKYYLMSQVDFCITSTANYLPIMGIEVDSHYHDDPKQQERDRKKDRIFEAGGVPLLRLRAHGQPTDSGLRASIDEAVRALRTDLTATADRGARYSRLALEIDFEQFGLKNPPPTDE